MPRLSQIAFRLARTARLTAIARRWRPGAVVLCYHNVVAKPVEVADPGLHLPREQFADQMAWLAQHFSVVPLEELARRTARGDSLRGLAAITFDDAYLGTLHNALPVLRSFNAPCTIFVPSAYPGARDGFWWDDPWAASGSIDGAPRQRWLEELQGDAGRIRQDAGGAAAVLPAECRAASWTALRAARSPLVRLGAHSVTHRNLTALDDTALEGEMRECMARVTDETGERPGWLAYPYGLWDARVVAAARVAGYDGALTLEGADVLPKHDPLTWSRINIPSGISMDGFEAWLSGFSHLRSQRRHVGHAGRGAT